MKRRCWVLWLLLTFLSATAEVHRYSSTWTSPSDNETGSHPLGNGDIAAQVWVEAATGDVLFYLSKSDAWDANGQIKKVGRVRLVMSPPLDTVSFNQTLSLQEGTICVEAGDRRLEFWVSATHPRFAVTVDGAEEMKVSVEIWRNDSSTDDAAASGATFCENRTVAADLLWTPHCVTSLAWAHRVEERDSAYFHDTLTRQGMGAALTNLSDPLSNLTWGAMLRGGGGLQRAGDKELVGSGLTGRTTIEAFLLTVPRAPSLEDWQQQLEALVTAADADGDLEADLESSKQWWADFWDRSFVDIDSQEPGKGEGFFLVSQQYANQRFLDAANGRPAKTFSTPIKFNGQAWTVDVGQGPDYRDWAGDFWWQNTRQPYYNALQAGDLDLQRPLYDFYKRILPLAEARNEIYFNHSGAFIPETMTFFGAYRPADYGCGNDHPPITENTYIRYHIVAGLELINLLLDDMWFYPQDMDEVLSEWLVPFAATLLTHYEKHWPGRNSSSGKMDMWPAQSLETWQCVTLPPTREDCVSNPAPDIAGLAAVLPRLLALPPSEHISADLRLQWQRMLDVVPELPRKMGTEGTEVLADGFSLPATSTNSENTALYALHPFRLFGTSRPADGAEALALANASFVQRPFPCNSGWCQDLLDAALLGLGDEAWSEVLSRAMAPGTWRWNGFSSHFQDYEPSLDHLSFMRTALHWMLLSPSDDEGSRVLTLFPAWPASVDVHFKLHAPLNTTVEAACVGGALTLLVVEPPEREADVRLAGCLS